MPLERYQQKRDFGSTPEPRGSDRPRPGSLRFVVQEHQARRLHHDFRLELDGVLKSWAVPKGLSLNPEDKRLAVMVEDHPLEYRTFEGVIPAGNYGAGTVMVWDEGAYTAVGTQDRAASDAAIRKGLESGDVKFLLFGKKLQGEFALVRLKKGKGNEWLLIKKRDRFASTEPIPGEDRSVLSHRTMAEIAARAPGEGRIWTSSGTPVAPKRQSAEMPRKVKPMLATLVDAPFDRPGWWFEVKWDGYRALAEIEDGKVKLYSRTGLTLADKFAALVPPLQTFAHDVLLDGEVVVVDDEGKPQFEWLQGYPRARQGRLVYYVFDLLYLDGQDLRSLPLWRRKELLRPLVRGFTNILFSDHVEEKGIAFFEAVAARGLEGAVGKKATSSYQTGRRSPDWVKLKTHMQQEAVIAGYTEPRGSRQALGAVVLGVYEGDELLYIGHAGSGFTERSLADVYAKLQPLVRKKCPFRKRPAKSDTPVHWVEPRLVCAVRFREWTSDGHIRHPVFLGLTEDRPAKSVRREVPQALEEVLPANHASAVRKPAPPARTSTSPSRPAAKKEALPFTFTNLDKVYWPEDGYTKGDLINYYREVTSFILPYLHDRPLSLNRHPDGIHGESFFQKDVSKQLPAPWIKTTLIPSGHGGRTIRYMVCDNEATLLYMANLGCIEINCWSSRIQSLERPDYLVIDLDPQDTPYSQVVEAAQVVRGLLEKSCAPCFCKTSGKRGMHIYVPLGARYDFDQARQFGEIVAHLVYRKLPQFTSLVRDPAKRRQQVYLDFLQNRRGATMASVYAVRPIPGACVSTPVRWKEVTKKLDPSKFTIRTVPRRLEKVGDVWNGLLEAAADLGDCLTRLQSLS